MADTWLHIGAETTELAQEEAVAMRIGSASIAREHFRHDPPTPLELESAIAAVEDEIARVHDAGAGGSRLFTRDGLLRDIALEIGVPSAAEMALALDAVENAFGRLPRRATGNEKGGKEKAAALLILRELMHHFGFASLVVRAA